MSSGRKHCRWPFSILKKMCFACVPSTTRPAQLRSTACWCNNISTMTTGWSPGWTWELKDDWREMVAALSDSQTAAVALRVPPHHTHLWGSLSVFTQLICTLKLWSMTCRCLCMMLFDMHCKGWAGDDCSRRSLLLGFDDCVNRLFFLCIFKSKIVTPLSVSKRGCLTSNWKHRSSRPSGFSGDSFNIHLKISFFVLWSKRCLCSPLSLVLIRNHNYIRFYL